MRSLFTDLTNGTLAMRHILSPQDITWPYGIGSTPELSSTPLRPRPPLGIPTCLSSIGHTTHISSKQHDHPGPSTANNHNNTYIRSTQHAMFNDSNTLVIAITTWITTQMRYRAHNLRNYTTTNVVTNSY